MGGGGDERRGGGLSRLVSRLEIHHQTEAATHNLMISVVINGFII